MNGWSQGWYRDVEELVIHEEYGVYGGVVRVNDVGRLPWLLKLMFPWLLDFYWLPWLLKFNVSIAIVKLSPPSSPGESFCTVCLEDTPNSDHSGEGCIGRGFFIRLPWLPC